jgi:DNA transformation protein
MSWDSSLFEWVQEALAPMGDVTMRRMMGGATLYLDGTVFAIIGSAGDLWFKADAETDAEWDAQGCQRFTAEMAGKIATMNYRRAPEEVHDDAEAMQRWAGLAVAAGQRAAAKKKPRRKS